MGDLDLGAVWDRAARRQACLAVADGFDPDGTPVFRHAWHRQQYPAITRASADDVPALVAEVEHLGTALEAATNDVAALRDERDLLQRVIDETDSLAEVERDQAIAERDRLAAQVARLEEQLEEIRQNAVEMSERES